MSAPTFDQDLGFGQGVEDLPVQEFVTHRAIEGPAVTISPRADRRDVECLHADPCQPFLHSVGDGLRAVVRSYVCLRPPHEEQLGESRQHILAAKSSCHGQGQALPTGLVDDREDAELAVVGGPALYEVIGPDV